MFNEPEQLIPWSVNATKTEIAKLAVTVFTIAQKGDRLAKTLLSDSADMLAEDAIACAQKLRKDAPSEALEFVFNGGVLLKNPAFLNAVARRLRAHFPRAKTTPLTVPSVHGAVSLARSGQLATPAPSHCPARARFESLTFPSALSDLTILSASPTEQRNPRSLKLDRMSAEKAVALMLSEDALLPAAITKEKRSIAAIAIRVAKAFATGGRLFYVGAGTSGRLGVLDASEIPPTFRAPREQVQGIIAGGRQALWSAVEGAEDDVQAGAASVTHRRVGQKDIVIGIAASGRTPFVWGALHEARRLGAHTVMLCFNPAIKAALKKLTPRQKNWSPHQLIALDLGPEVLTGSTRLKAGTATKLILNLISTLAMVQSGKVISNLMVDLNPSNVKLRDRATRMVAELTGRPTAEVTAALVSSGWVVKSAVSRLSSAGR
jgi:N-acetylmuramic acid 6-phosphate etherase